MASNLTALRRRCLNIKRVGDRDALWFFLVAIVLGSKYVPTSPDHIPHTLFQVSMSAQSWAFQKGSSIMAYVSISFPRSLDMLG